MEFPHYFGSMEQLFGLYHPAASVTTKAVLLCPPLGQDMVRCHRVYRQLARALAAQGIAALRFDYYGSGDSAGASAEVEWTRCIADTSAAADELRTLSGCDQVIAFGARLGANIAFAAAIEARFVGLVAWDPVIDGSAHAIRLDTLQDALRVDPMRFPSPRSAADAAGQWQGFAVGERLRQQIIELRLQLPPVQTLVLDTSPSAAPLDRDHAVPFAGATITKLQPATPWEDLSRLEHAILSPELVKTVTLHMREAA